ncbi:hypothetical protein POTOM_020081 [Populus tomentosa]|uniref:tRNA (adenine(58)-N(1))-methyltransferase non-catalytic subunit TRM6 n=1 Tax=Populus tomentosa TaxID=118781 RepID=A0A8X7ZT26_POPTO|nr:hypothetical protein POTOM_020081 [Populus tomentosa]
MSQNNIQSDSVQNRRVTWEGCSVLLDINDGDRLVFARLTAGSTLKIGNKNYSLRALIGCPFGSSSQIEIGTKGPYLSRDNRAIVDNNEAQTLTSEDIDEMRRQGAKGDEIIEALIANSATFEKKTAFSQEKYRIKKQKKYAPRVLLRRPSARSICEAYFKKYPNRIGKSKQGKDVTAEHVEPMDTTAWNSIQCREQDAVLSSVLLLRMHFYTLVLAFGYMGKET